MYSKQLVLRKNWLSLKYSEKDKTSNELGIRMKTEYSRRYYRRLCSMFSEGFLVQLPEVD